MDLLEIGLGHGFERIWLAEWESPGIQVLSIGIIEA